MPLTRSARYFFFLLLLVPNSYSACISAIFMSDLHAVRRKVGLLIEYYNIVTRAIKKMAPFVLVFLFSNGVRWVGSLATMRPYFQMKLAKFSLSQLV